MFVTNSRLRYSLYKVVLGGDRLLDTVHLHPVGACATRMLGQSVDYIGAHIADTLRCNTEVGLLTYAIGDTRVANYFLAFGAFAEGTNCYVAKLRPRDGFDGLEGPLMAQSGFAQGSGAFRLSRVLFNFSHDNSWFSDALPLNALEDRPVAHP